MIHRLAVSDQKGLNKPPTLECTLGCPNHGGGIECTLYALDVATGKELWKTDTGLSICAPFSTYILDGDQYLAILVGQAGNQQTANLPPTHGSHVLAYKLGATQTAINGTDGQTPMAAIPPSAASAQIAGTGSAPTPRSRSHGARPSIPASARCATETSRAFLHPH